MITMASKPLLTIEQQNFKQPLILCSDIITLLLKDILRVHIQPKDLYNAIRECPGLKIQKLRPDLLLPLSFPDYDTFDISLLYTLIQNLCPFLKPARGWETKPDYTEIEIGDDIKRLMLLGKEISSLLEGTSIFEFRPIWKELEPILLRTQDFLKSKKSKVNYKEKVTALEKADFDFIGSERYRHYLKVIFYLKQLANEGILRIIGQDKVLCGMPFFLVVETNLRFKSPMYSITWQRQTKEIEENIDINTDKYKGSTSTRLVIHRVSEEDEGVYHAFLEPASGMHGHPIFATSNPIVLTVLKVEDVMDEFEKWFCGKYKDKDLIHFYFGRKDMTKDKLNEGNEVIVAIVDNMEAIVKDVSVRLCGKDFPVIWKPWKEDFEEPSLGIEEELKLEEEYIDKLEEIEICRQKATKDLFQAHSNLQMITGSAYKIKNGEIVEKPCIVLYCSCKGIVPINEPKFPTEIEGIITDIREGLFHLQCNLNEDLCAFSKDLLNPLRMGASIGKEHANAEGTLGGFVKFKDGATDEVGFITCAHNFYSPDEMETDNMPQVPLTVVQPSHLQEGSQVCGKTVRSISSFSDVNEEHISVDATLVRLTERHPQQRLFFTDLLTTRLTKTGFSRKTFPQSISGNVLDLRKAKDRKLHQSKKYLKCGTTSGLTKGVLRYNLIGVKPTQKGKQLHNQKYKNQIRIQGINGNFSEKGDSGSLVFQVRDDGELDCIGMIVAGAPKIHSSAVTPIISVLNALDVNLFPDSTKTSGHPWSLVRWLIEGWRWAKNVCITLAQQIWFE